MAWDDEDLAEGAVALWHQIAGRLRNAMDAGEFVEGDLLPSEAQIVSRFGVSRATARSAMDQLETEGRVARRSGRGTHVLPPQVELPLNLLSSFSEDMRSRGLVPSYGELRISNDELNATAAEALDAATGDEALRVERLLLANGMAIAHSTSWLSPALIPPREAAASETLRRQPLYEWIEASYGVRVAAGTEVIEGVIADEHLARELSIPIGAAILQTSRIARSREGTPVEYVERHYRADRYRYRIELVRP